MVTNHKPGILYVYKDADIPDYIRFGFSTVPIKEKVKYAEDNKPFNTIKVLYASPEKIADVKIIYYGLLIKLMDMDAFKYDEKPKKGWFHKSNKPLIEKILIDWIQEQKVSGDS